MNQIDATQLLAQMRRLTLEAQSGVSTASGSVDTAGSSDDFANLLRTSIESVNEAQASASAMANAFVLGDVDVSLPEVMIALQKANLSFQAMTEVRNRLVSAYQEVMSMAV